MVENITADLKKIEELEKGVLNDKYAPVFHLKAPTGWLNDPNGLCQAYGVHHIFFQYSPYEAKGGDKYWGHYSTKDFISYDYNGIFMSPDTKSDADGVFSGSCYADNGEFYFFYTGNVMEPGDYDYTYAGRGANTICVKLTDTYVDSDVTHDLKQTVLENKDYPERLSCHVRDPKVWKHGNVYYMVLGGRTVDDKGLVMLYSSSDMRTWQFVRYIETFDSFGFMWECPDYFEIDGRSILSLSPQGLPSEEYRFQNIYQTGYFIDDSLAELCNGGNGTLHVSPGSFHEWDMGFDFYAPQTYMDEAGRRILIGWMGVPDAEYDHDPSIELGWQHMLTVPRQLIFDENKNRIRQVPVKELEKLRKNKLSSLECLPKAYELEWNNIQDKDIVITFDKNLTFKYESGILELCFTGEGYGRGARRLVLSDGDILDNIRILVDTCAMEIFINDGSYVFTTKFFIDNDVRTIEGLEDDACIWALV